MVSKSSDDSPLRSKEDDMLGFRDFADGIIRTIEDLSENNTPFTMAVFGPWGSGKTSLMKILDDMLSEDYKTIFFNSWEYGNEKKPWIPFMVSAVDELFDKEMDRTELVKNIFMFSTDVVLQTYSQLDVTADSILDIFRGSKKTTPFKKWSDQDTNVVVERVTKIRKFKKAIEKRTQELPNRKLIIFIDDLDRIPENLIDFINSLKIFFDIKGCIFILSCDYNILTGELKRKYPPYICEDYFEKIVQTEFYIPGINEQAIGSYLRFLTEWDDTEIEKATQLVIHSIGGNPRKIKRAVNATVLIRNVFERKLEGILQEFERPKTKIIREIDGKEVREEPDGLKRDIVSIFNPERAFNVLFDEIALFKLICLRARWFDIYELILNDEKKQEVFISLQQGAEGHISQLMGNRGIS